MHVIFAPWAGGMSVRRRVNRMSHGAQRYAADSRQKVALPVHGAADPPRPLHAPDPLHLPIARRDAGDGNVAALQHDVDFCYDYPMILRALTSIVKGVCESLLTCLGIIIYHSGLAHLVIRRRRAPRVLVYHACEESESDFTRGLKINTMPALLERHLEFLKRHYRIVPLAALVDGDPPDFSVVITFDDGFRSVHSNALPLLAARNVPATCYLVTDVIDDAALIWIVELNWFLRRHRSAARQLVSDVLGVSRFCSTHRLVRCAIARYDPVKIADLLRKLRAAFGPVAAPPGRLHLDRAEIKELAESGFTFGNHCASHAVLTNLDPDECRQEVDRARMQLLDVPGSVSSLAYPFGIYDDAVERIAREMGYRSLMLVEGDNEPFDRYRVGRLNVTSVAPAVLFAHLELLAPFKFRIKRWLA
jgi:peptidoglycan/xylan/chitin deacetylase (PgdA/CDA1 family)